MAAKTLTERLAQFRSVHGDRYDYSLVSGSLRWNSKIRVICRVHGEFLPIVNNHARGAGCSSCAGIKTLTLSERTSHAMSIHNGKYDYSLWPEYITSKHKVDTICQDHGIWTHTVSNHINKKSGCPKCAGNLERTKEEFTNKASTVHDGKYSYDLSSGRVSNNSPVTIICPDHGEFVQLATNHLSGKGCPSCGKYGYDPKRPGSLYALKSECGQFIKIGISNNVGRRHQQLLNSTPFKWSCIKVISDDDGAVAQSIERIFRRKFKSAEMKGFDGATEWFEMTPRAIAWLDAVY